MNVGKLSLLCLAVGVISITGITKAKASEKPTQYMFDGVHVIVGKTESRQFKINKKYHDALLAFGKHYEDNVDIKSKRVASTITKKMVSQSYTFHAKANDVKRMINVYHWTHQDELAINRFAFDVINKLRRQFNRPQIRYSRVMKQFTKEVMHNYDMDHWSSWNGHDVPAVNKVAAKYGLPYDPAFQSYENSSISSVVTPKLLSNISVADIKAEIWYVIGSMMFEDQDEKQGHALSLSGAWYSPKNKYTLGYLGYDHEGALHLEMANQLDLPKSMRK